MKKVKTGIVAIIGPSNVGKSSLLNSFLGYSWSIVTAKPQTTRKRFLGIYNQENLQISFLDSPGLIEDKEGMNEFLQKEFMNIIKLADALLIMFSIDNKDLILWKKLFNLCVKSNKDFLVFINKMDLKDEHKDEYKKNYYEIINICNKRKIRPIMGSIKNDTEAIKNEIINQLFPIIPESVGFLFEEELLTNEPIRNIAAEFIRKQCLENLHQEIPYLLAVRINKFEEKKDIIIIFAEIIVSRESHKKIVIGHKGGMIKKIGQESRINIEELVQKKVFLDLKVKCRVNWFKNNLLMKDLGYVVQK